MLIYKCDLCRKEIKNDSDKVIAGRDYDRYTFCQKCGQPILKFLKRHKLIKE